MTNRSSDAAANKPPVLSSLEIYELLSMRLIANLSTVDDDGSIHLLPMWFLRIGNDICIPTSRYTHKYRNLRARPHASVTDQSLDPFEVCHVGSTEQPQRRLLSVQRRRRNRNGTGWFRQLDG
jgi:nitroimidazol reductase NimA-like FMN-containing flavoprotein (pyridoxamine 5'-phosphate oxidase superfamily)